MDKAYYTEAMNDACSRLSRAVKAEYKAPKPNTIVKKGATLLVVLNRQSRA